MVLIDKFVQHQRLNCPELTFWSHPRRKFFVSADVAANARREKTAPSIPPISLEAVKRIQLPSTRYQEHLNSRLSWSRIQS